MKTQDVGTHCGPLLISDPCAALRRATRAVTHLYDLVLAPTGLKCTQFFLLNAIYEAGEIAQWYLACQYGVGEDTLSRRLSVLRKAGLITFRIGQEHPGEKLYRLTELGVSRFKDALPAWERAQARLQTVMGAEQWEQLLKVAGAVAAEARKAETARLANTVTPRAFAASAAEGPITGES
jgi:DNA-binding MarR family transcriptional regulator